MVVDERARRELYERAEVALGRDGADTMMALLPPVGWADVVTRHDLDQKTDAVDRRFDAVNQRFDESEQRILQTMTWRLMQVMVAVVGILLAVIVPLVA
jgi:hypothetical protein